MSEIPAVEPTEEVSAATSPDTNNEVQDSPKESALRYVDEQIRNLQSRRQIFDTNLRGEIEGRNKDLAKRGFGSDKFLTHDSGITSEDIEDNKQRLSILEKLRNLIDAI